MKKTIFLHLGYPKTGTTFLQREIFCKTKDLIYLGKSDNYRTATVLDLVVNELRTIDDNRFNKNISSYVDRIKSIIDIYPYGNKFVYSNEVLLQQLFCPNLTTVNLIERLLHLLKLTGFSVFLLATDRNKADLISSWYSEAPHHFSGYCPRWDSFDSFKEDLFQRTSDQTVSSFIESLKLEKIKKKLSINSDEFLILSFECFQNNFPSYHEQLIAFMRIRAQDIKITNTKKINSSIFKDSKRHVKQYNPTIPELIARFMPYKLKKNLPFPIKKILFKYRDRTENFFAYNKFMRALANLIQNIFLKKNTSQIYFTDSEREFLENIFKN